MPTYSVPAGVPTIIAQNIVYALPSRAVTIMAEPACEVGQTITGPWTAIPAPPGNRVAASFIRCTTGAATVTAKI